MGRKEEEMRCRYEECGRMCRSKASVVMNPKIKRLLN